MKTTKLLSILLLLSITSITQAVELKGEMTQGAMIIGKTAPGSQVFLNDKPVMISKQGDFVFGFGRDEKLNHQVKVIKADGKVETKAIKLTKRSYKIDRLTLDEKFVSPPESVYKRIREDNRLVGKARAVVTDKLQFLQPMIMPAKGRISGVYGSQRILNGKPKRPHFGLDVAAPTGTKVVAPIDGTVVLVHNDMYYTGGTLIIEHGHKITSTYIHLSKVLVKEGDEVKQGDIIAEIGATGRVTGPHLDWRLNWGSVRLDPALLVDIKP